MSQGAVENELFPYVTAAITRNELHEEKAAIR
jgi:hypothetical protein